MGCARGRLRRRVSRPPCAERVLQSGQQVRSNPRASGHAPGGGSRHTGASEASEMPGAPSPPAVGVGTGTVRPRLGRSFSSDRTSAQPGSRVGRGNVVRALPSPGMQPVSSPLVGAVRIPAGIARSPRPAHTETSPWHHAAHRPVANRLARRDPRQKVTYEARRRAFHPGAAGRASGARPGSAHGGPIRRDRLGGVDRHASAGGGGARAEPVGPCRRLFRSVPMGPHLGPPPLSR